MDLFDQRRHLPLLATAGSNLNPYDDLRVRIGAELDVVGRAETTVGHLHDRGLGVCLETRAFSLSSAVFFASSSGIGSRALWIRSSRSRAARSRAFCCPRLASPPDRSPLHPAGAVPGSGRPASISPGSRSASERSGPRTGPHAHAVLSHTVEINQILLH